MTPPKDKKSTKVVSSNSGASAKFPGPQFLPPAAPVVQVELPLQNAITPTSEKPATPPSPPWAAGKPVTEIWVLGFFSVCFAMGLIAAYVADGGVLKVLLSIAAVPCLALMIRMPGSGALQANHERIERVTFVLSLTTILSIVVHLLFPGLSGVANEPVVKHSAELAIGHAAAVGFLKALAFLVRK